MTKPSFREAQNIFAETFVNSDLLDFPHEGEKGVTDTLDKKGAYTMMRAPFHDQESITKMWLRAYFQIWAVHQVGSTRVTHEDVLEYKGKLKAAFAAQAKGRLETTKECTAFFEELSHSAPGQEWKKVAEMAEKIDKLTAAEQCLTENGELNESYLQAQFSQVFETLEQRKNVPEKQRQTARIRPALSFPALSLFSSPQHDPAAA